MTTPCTLPDRHYHKFFGVVRQKVARLKLNQLNYPQVDLGVGGNHLPPNLAQWLTDTFGVSAVTFTIARIARCSRY